MSLKIYLDECAYSKLLVKHLRRAGHDVKTPNDAATMSRADQLHLQYAIAEDRVLVTKDADDFEALHRQDAQHPGILAIRQDNDPAKDMKDSDIVRAIENLIQAGVPIRGQFCNLNCWQY